MARNKKLRDYPETLFEEGSPVVVDKMQLCYNNDYGVNVLQITFRNVEAMTLYGLSIMIETFDKNGNPPADREVEYNYYGLEIPDGRTFGTSEDIVMEEEAVSFAIRVIRAEYPGDDSFRGDIRLRPMPEPEALETLGEFEEPFRAQVAEKKPNLKLHCVPEKKNFYWRCVCGRIYPKDSEQCRTCRVERDWITGIVPKLKPEQPAQEPEVSYGQSIAIMGADLTDEDRKVVLRLIGIEESDFAQFTVVPVTIEQEHAYLDATIDPNLIGNASKSCLLITSTAPGSGLNISMYNINYCTEDMYREALQSVGITDANVVIAAARTSAGTSALTGIYLAPQYLTGTEQ